MDNPHTEGGSQDYYSIHRSQVGCVCKSQRHKAVVELVDTTLLRRPYSKLPKTEQQVKSYIMRGS